MAGLASACRAGSRRVFPSAATASSSPAVSRSSSSPTVAYQLIAQHGPLARRPRRPLPAGLAARRPDHVAMLFGHRSGMGDFGNDFSAQLRDLVLSDLRRVFRYDEVLDLIRTSPRRRPGHDVPLHNANYIVLGAILQRLTEELWADDGDRHRAARAPTHALRPRRPRRRRSRVFHGLFDVRHRFTARYRGLSPRRRAHGRSGRRRTVLDPPRPAHASRTVLRERRPLRGAADTLGGLGEHADRTALVSATAS